jgi:hypothetical protein
MQSAPLAPSENGSAATEEKTDSISRHDAMPDQPRAKEARHNAGNIIRFRLRAVPTGTNGTQPAEERERCQDGEAHKADVLQNKRERKRRKSGDRHRRSIDCTGAPMQLATLLSQHGHQAGEQRKTAASHVDHQ